MITQGWTRSSRCADGACIETRRQLGLIAARDSKYAQRGEASPEVKHDYAEWQEGLDAVWAGLPARVAFPRIAAELTDLDEHEWDAFEQGVLLGEFDLPRGMSLEIKPNADVAESIAWHIIEDHGWECQRWSRSDLASTIQGIYSPWSAWDSNDQDWFAARVAETIGIPSPLLASR